MFRGFRLKAGGAMRFAFLALYCGKQCGAPGMTLPVLLRSPCSFAAGFPCLLLWQKIRVDPWLKFPAAFRGCESGAHCVTRLTFRVVRVFRGLRPGYGVG